MSSSCDEGRRRGLGSASRQGRPPKARALPAVLRESHAAAYMRMPRHMPRHLPQHRTTSAPAIASGARDAEPKPRGQLLHSAACGFGEQRPLLEGRTVSFGRWDGQVTFALVGGALRASACARVCCAGASSPTCPARRDGPLRGSNPLGPGRWLGRAAHRRPASATRVDWGRSLLYRRPWRAVDGGCCSRRGSYPRDRPKTVASMNAGRCGLPCVSAARLLALLLASIA